MELIPSEILYDILSSIKLIDIATIAKTSLALNSKCKDDRLWKRMVDLESSRTQINTGGRQFTLLESQPVSFNTTWLQTFKDITRVIYTVSARIYGDSYLP